MLQRGVLLVSLAGERQGLMKSLLKTAGERRQLKTSFLFHHALKRMLVLAREIHHLCDLGLGHFISIGPAFSNTMLVHMQHDARRLLAALLKEPLQYVNDELHRRVVVVQN